MVPLTIVFLLSLLGSVAAFSVFIFMRVEVLRLSNAESIAAVVEQLGRAKAEIVDRIGVLEAAAAAGEDLSAPLADLAAAAQALDDVVPDDGPVEG